MAAHSLMENRYFPVTSGCCAINILRNCTAFRGFLENVRRSAPHIVMSVGKNGRSFIEGFRISFFDLAVCFENMDVMCVARHVHC